MIRILLADDHTILRQGLRSLISALPGMSVVGEAGNGREAVQMARELHPDVVIMDVSMPELNGIDATIQVRAADSSVRIIALSMYSDRRFVHQMFKAGASGYLLKDCAGEELARAIRTVMDGQAYLSPAIAGVVVGEFLRGLTSEGATGFPTLTSREREVLQLIAEGHSTKEVALRLGISGKTVETHRRQIMEKLHADNIATLTKYAIREGLTQL